VRPGRDRRRAPRPGHVDLTPRWGRSGRATRHPQLPAEELHDRRDEHHPHRVASIRMPSRPSPKTFRRGAGREDEPEHADHDGRRRVITGRLGSPSATAVELSPERRHSHGCATAGRPRSHGQAEENVNIINGITGRSDRCPIPKTTEPAHWKTATITRRRRPPTGGHDDRLDRDGHRPDTASAAGRTQQHRADHPGEPVDDRCGVDRPAVSPP